MKMKRPDRRRSVREGRGQDRERTMTSTTVAWGSRLRSGQMFLLLPYRLLICWLLLFLPMMIEYTHDVRRSIHNYPEGESERREWRIFNPSFFSWTESRCIKSNKKTCSEMIETIVSWESWELGWVQCPSIFHIPHVAHSHQLEITKKIQLFQNFQTELLTGTHSHSLFMPKAFPSLTPMKPESDYEVTWKKIVFSVGISESGTNSKEVSKGWELGSQSWESKLKKGNL